MINNVFFNQEICHFYYIILSEPEWNKAINSSTVIKYRILPLIDFDRIINENKYISDTFYILHKYEVIKKLIACISQ
jgi:hypothetical protein